MYKRAREQENTTRGPEKKDWSYLPVNVQDEILSLVARLPAFSGLMPMTSRTSRGRKYWRTIILPTLTVSKDWYTSMIVLISANGPDALLDYAPENYFRLHLDTHMYSISQCAMPLYARITMKMKKPISRHHPLIVRKLSWYLIRCLDRNFANCVGSLLLWGASPDAKTEDGYSALYLAVQRRKPALVDILISHNPTKYEEEEGRSPLALAAMTYQVTAMYSLLAGGANPYIKFTYGKKSYSLVSWVCMSADERMVRCLIDHGVDMLKMVKKDVDHPLVIAVAADNIFVVELLLKTGVKCKNIERVMFTNKLKCPPRIMSLLTRFDQWPPALRN